MTNTIVASSHNVSRDRTSLRAMKRAIGSSSRDSDGSMRGDDGSRHPPHAVRGQPTLDVVENDITRGH